jgi:hypothetical protein
MKKPAWWMWGMLTLAIVWGNLIPVTKAQDWSKFCGAVGEEIVNHRPCLGCTDDSGGKCCHVSTCQQVSESPECNFTDPDNDTCMAWDGITEPIGAHWCYAS